MVPTAPSPIPKVSQALAVLGMPATPLCRTLLLEPKESTIQLQEVTAEKGQGVAMGREKDTPRTGVAADTVMERAAVGMEMALVMEMVVVTEMDIATQKAAVVILMAIGMGRTGMEEVQAGMGRAGVQVMVGMGKAGRKVVIVRARRTPKRTAARWTRWTRQTRRTASQIRQRMVLLSQSHPNAKRVDGTVKRLCVKREVSCL